MGFFVKSGSSLKRRVHYVQYQYFFLFYILLIWGAYALNAPPSACGLAAVRV